MNGFASTVTDIRLESRSGLEAVWWMSLDQTKFTPGTTGTLEAITRSGTRLSIPVTNVVVDQEGVTWHVVEKPLAAGTEVTGHLASTLVA